MTEPPHSVKTRRPDRPLSHLHGLCRSRPDLTLRRGYSLQEDAAASFGSGNLAQAQTLAAIGHVHATLAAASAAALQDRGDLREWCRVTAKKAY